MKKTSFKLSIRRLVLATSFPPILHIYRFFYGMVTFMALRIFKKYPAIKAVYLRRGGARGEILPLISDIDFAVIGEQMEEEDKKNLYRDYEKLARATTLLDQTLEVYDEETLHKHYQTNDYFQYRFMEGKETWKLLYGKDYLLDLPTLPIEKMYGGFYTEIKVWWSLFAWRFFQDRKYNDEAVTRNNACYKTVSEILKMDLALNHHVLTFSRNEALEQAKAHLTGKERLLVDKLQVIARKSFRMDEEGILDETKDFLLNYLDRFYWKFRDHPFAHSIKDVLQRIDCPEVERFESEKNSTYVRQLVNYLKEKWSYTYKGTHLVSSAYFNIDELLLMIEIDPKRFPTVMDIAALNRFHWNAQRQTISPIKLFLLLPNAAFQIDSDDLKKSWQSIVCPPCNPELFELLGLPESVIDGRGYQPVMGSVWTPLVEHFFWEEKLLFYELLDNPSIYKLNSLDFLRIFWKTAQLILLNRSAQSDKILYPLTVPAIERALAAEHIPLPAPLEPLSVAYWNELEGKTTDIAILIPTAIDYLKKINL
jgi:predicted nucleotidyltransferase